MTKEEAKANQERIAKHFDLGWWYGVDCEKCCGVYPKFDTEGNSTCAKMFCVCEVCGKRTKGYEMAWLARDAWNRHEYTSEYTQLSLF